MGILKENILELRRYPRQFVVSDQPTDRLGDLISFQIGGFYVYHCPLLNVYKQVNAANQYFAVLFGYAIDSDNYDLTEMDLLDRILGINSIGEISKYISSLCGRFSIFIFYDKEGYVFHDPTGLRTVYFSTSLSRSVFGTQPLILGEFGTLEAGYKSELFFHSDYFKTADEYWLPCGLSVYENVEQLVPNHYLRLSEKKQVRFWPYAQIERFSFNDLVDFLSDYLVDAIRHANKRFDLILPLTSGLDSRLLLAASRDVANDLGFYTRIHKSNISLSHQDLVIPSKILKAIGQKHNIVVADQQIPPSIEERYKLNNSTSRFQDCATLFSTGAGILKDKYVMYGNVSELIKIRKPSKSYSSLSSFDIIPDGWFDIGFVKHTLEDWFAIAIDIEKEFGIHPYELFYWEHRLGNWAARAYNENDFAFEVYTPFNSRAVLSAALMLDINMRALPEAKLHKTIIKRLWPEIDSFPYNQKSKAILFKEWARKIGRVSRISKLILSLNNFLNN